MNLPGIRFGTHIQLRFKQPNVSDEYRTARLGSAKEMANAMWVKAGMVNVNAESTQPDNPYYLRQIAAVADGEAYQAVQIYANPSGLDVLCFDRHEEQLTYQANQLVDWCKQVAKEIPEAEMEVFVSNEGDASITTNEQMQAKFEQMNWTYTTPTPEGQLAS